MACSGTSEAVDEVSAVVGASGVRGRSIGATTVGLWAERHGLGPAMCRGLRGSNRTWYSVHD